MLGQQSVMVFDIETIPDMEAIRFEYGIPMDSSMSEADLAQAAFDVQQEKSGNTFLPHIMHRVVAISCLLRQGRDKVYIGSLGKPESGEKELVSEFYRLIREYTPNLVSWNGSAFDLPVLNYRAMLYGIDAGRFWQSDGDFKWNNYTNRYHSRHCDVMDVLALNNGRANAPLNLMAKLCGFPGKLSSDGSQVWDSFQNGHIEGIRHYCETDVANTYLLYLRYLNISGKLDAAGEDRELALLARHLEGKNKPHWQEFLEAWQVNSKRRADIRHVIGFDGFAAGQSN